MTESVARMTCPGGKRLALKKQICCYLPSAVLIAVMATSLGCRRRPHPTAYVPSKEEIDLDRYNQAVRAGQYELAEDGLKAMCKNEPICPRACYDLTRLFFKLGRLKEAQTETLQFLKDFPEHALSPVAVKRLARNYVESGQLEQGITVLETLAHDIKGSDVHDSVLFQIAMLLKESNRSEDEASTLMQIVDEYDRFESQVWDDAIWRVIGILEEQGDDKGEQLLLERFLATRESSWFIGSYNSPYHDDALLRLGHLFFETGHPQKALKLFMELANLKTSRLRDEALLGAAEVRHAEGRNNKACRLLQQIIVEMPRATARNKAIEMSAVNRCK